MEVGPPLVVDVTRSGHIESQHLVDVAIIGHDGALLAAAGDPTRRTFWRSAAKPFQALPLLETGAADAFGFDDAMLALACASHSSEPTHVALARAMLAQGGNAESDLACGPHPSISPAQRDALLCAGVTLTSIHNNCSGKHAAMLALAKHLHVETAGYQAEGHPVQTRIFDVVQRMTGLNADAIAIGHDGCTAACFFLSLEGMARAWMHLGHDDDDGPRRLRQAMWAHPHLVAGQGRTCTDILATAPQRVLAKVGAEGLYCGAICDATNGVGFALKVRSGEGRAASVALIAVLRALDEKFGFGLPLAAWRTIARPDVVDTWGVPVGALSAHGFSL